jgi:hypothetical protein
MCVNNLIAFSEAHFLDIETRKWLEVNNNPCAIKDTVTITIHATLSKIISR